MDFTQWAQYWANRYAWAIQKRPDLDPEDLLQAAFLGIIRAKKHYKPDKGKFSTYSVFFIRHEIRDLIGIRDGKDLPPEVISLDEPIDPEGDITRLEMISDDTIPDPDEKLIAEDRKRAVHDAVDRLEADQREVVTIHYFKGKTAPEAAVEMHISPLRVRLLLDKAKIRLRRDYILRKLCDMNMHRPCMRSVGVTRFNSTFTSAVEEAVLWREAHISPLLAALDEQEEYCKQ